MFIPIFDVTTLHLIRHRVDVIAPLPWFALINQLPHTYTHIRTTAPPSTRPSTRSGRNVTRFFYPHTTEART